MAEKLKYKRVLIKLSGEALAAPGEGGVDGKALGEIAKDIYEVAKMGCEVGVVIGGGNIWRFRDFKDVKLDRVTSDTMGMMATVMNSLALEAALKDMKAKVRAVSSFSAPKAMEDYVPKRALHHMKSGRIVIFAGGTGSPFFTTDSAAALRALEMQCDAVIKATKVDYVYDKDPMKHKDAKKFEKMTFAQVLDKKLGVMDMTCAALLQEGNVPMLVVNMGKKGNLKKAVKGEKVGTLITK